MLSLSMVVIAALVGAGGLGVPVVRALNTVQVGMGFEAGFTIVLLAIILDRISRPPNAERRDERRRRIPERRHPVRAPSRARGRRAISEALARSMRAARAPRFPRSSASSSASPAPSLSVARGEISVLMGLSGSGKSTLLRAANGLNPVTRGARAGARRRIGIDVATCDALQMRRLRRERVAMVFQQFGLLPWRTVRDNVGFGLELRGEPGASAAGRSSTRSSNWSGCRNGPSATSASCRAACSSASASRARSPPMPTSC
jgi:hypothetical protein